MKEYKNQMWPFLSMEDGLTVGFEALSLVALGLVAIKFKQQGTLTQCC